MNFRPHLLALLAFIGLVLAPGAFAQNGAPQAPTVRSIDVQYAGPQTVSKEKILANMRTRVGRPYSEAVVEEDIRNIYATGNISNVRIFGEPTPDGVRVIVVVATKAQVTDVAIEGVTRLNAGRVRKQIATKPGDALSEAAIEADRQKIIEYYRSKGLEVDVRTNIETNERLGTARVVFTIVEGGKTTISEVRFEGNTAVSDKDLRHVTKTKPRSIVHIFSQTGRLNSELLDQDVVAIRELYQNRGYIDAEVQAPRVERAGDKVAVVFTIVEGPQYHVGRITYNNLNVFTPEDVTKAAKVRTGEVYSPAAVRADIKAIQDLYGSRGYVDFQAGATTAPGGPQIIDVTYTVEEGVQTYVEKINISGNTRTKDKVIRREVAVAPGDIFNTVRVEASRQRLQNLNYFSRVDVYPTDTLVPGRKDLNILVEEKRTGSFNFGAGFSSIDSLLGFAEITQGNFDITNWPRFTGGGEKFRLRIQYGVRRKDFVVALTEPYFMDMKLSVGGEAFYREASFVSDVYSESRIGFDLNARKALTEFTFVRFGYRLEQIGIEDVDKDASEVIKQEAGERLKSMVSAGITYDTRDSVFLTRRGERIDLFGYLAGGFLGGDTDIYGFDLEGSKYILFPGDTILTLNGEVAVVDTWAGGERVPIFDRLYLGGANNLRGFRYREVGPKDKHGEPIGGSTLARATVEYTFPVIDKVRGAVFYDIGFVNSGAYDFAPSKDENGSGGLNQDVGIGVRLDLPIGPVRIDYGFPLQSDRFNGGSGKFNFNIGYQF
ncbi:outer membrane protein assembly factor BamA [Verrucomicrobiota bacterium sgz303538]